MIKRNIPAGTVRIQNGTSANPNNTVTRQTEFDAIHIKPGKEKFIYYTMQGKIELIGYGTGNPSSPVVYDAMYYMRGLTATLNGSYFDHVQARWKL